MVTTTEQLRVTNPLMLWLFARGWEEPVDPNLGPLVSAIIIHALADKVADPETRTQIQRAARKEVNRLAQKAVNA